MNNMIELSIDGDTSSDEPAMKKPRDCERSSCEMVVYRGHEEPLPVEDTCLINRLPSEVLEMIFSHLPRRHRKNVRLVCKSWYSKCNRNEKIFIFFKRHLKHLENTGFKHLDLFINHGYLPKTLYEKIGSRIHSLELEYCRLGDQLMKNMILSCDNLRRLRVVLLEPSICSSQTLETLNVVRNRLETFEIGGILLPDSFINEWKRICKALFRIFPRVVHCSSEPGPFRGYATVVEHIALSFSKELEETDESALALSLAFPLSDNLDNRRKALDALSTIRLTTVSLTYLRRIYTPEDEDALVNFFTHHQNLTSVEIVFYNTISRGMLRNVLFQIIMCCTELKKLRFCENINWLCYLTAAELSQFQEKTLTLEKLSINGFVVENCSLSTLPSLWNNHQFGYGLIHFLQNFCHLQHLTIEYKLSDKILQTIFQFMIDLRSLKIRLDSSNTNFSITGRSNDSNDDSVIGYSIKRLKNLERLEITWTTNIDRKTDDTIFYEFEFPKLWYLRCSTPEHSSTLIRIGRNAPLLREIDLYWSSKITYESLMDFCRITKSLRVIHVQPGKSLAILGEVEKIFKVCPTLKFLNTSGRQYFYEPFTEKVKFVSVNYFSSPFACDCYEHLL